MPTDSFIKRVFSNPALGLLPYLVFSVLIGQVDTLYAYAVGFGLSVVPFVFRIRKEFRILYDISALSFFVAFLLLFVLLPDFQPKLSFILAEVVLLLSLLIFILFRKRLIRMVLRKGVGKKKFCFYESLRIAYQLQYALTFHLIILLGVRLFSTINLTVADTAIVLNLFQIIIVVIIVLEAVRLRLLNNRLKYEEWLPVINESGAVQGRVAKSVSEKMKNKFLHPIVRIALIYDGMLYLKERGNSRLLDPGKLDYPFETYMQYKHNIDQAIKNATKEEIETDSIPVRFILKYVFENERTKRLVFLYVSVIKSEEEFNSLSLKGGKLWTTNQIEDNIGSDIFSETFELEFDYLKNTVLMSELLIKKSQ